MINPIMINFINKGSFGSIYEDNNNNIYKVTNLICNTDNNFILERNNIIEVIFLNFFKNINKVNDNQQNNVNDNDNEYIIQTKESFIITKSNFKNYFIFSNNRVWESESLNYLIINKLNKYNKIVLPIIYDFKDIINKFKKYSEELIIALAKLHQNGFIHGDISSANIMMKNDQLILIDLGAIKSMYLNDYLNTCTITSRSPEDINYNTNKSLAYIANGVKSDIWSIGIFLSEIILGYSIIIKLYNEINNRNSNSMYVELKMLKFYNSINFIEVEALFKNEIAKKYININNNNKDDYIELIRLCKIVEKILVINPNNRIDSIEKIYEDIFNKKFEYNFIKKYSYNYDFLLNENFYNFRKRYYSNVIQRCLDISDVLVIPLLIDLLDRFFNELIKNNIDFYNLTHLQLYNLTRSFIFLASSLIVTDNYDYCLITKIKSHNVHDIQTTIIFVLNTLDYDIYRPFTFSQSLQNNDPKNVLQYIYNNIILYNMINITPEYYVNEINKFFS